MRQARAHKRDDESGGMEWALMDIGVELHWQGWRLEAPAYRDRLRCLRLKRAATHRGCADTTTRNPHLKTSEWVLVGWVKCRRRSERSNLDRKPSHPSSVATNK